MRRIISYWLDGPPGNPLGLTARMSEPSPTVRAARSVARKVLPARVRSFLRRSWRELPHWAHDLPIDFREWITRSPGRIPPAWLRSHVSLTSSRAELLDVGRQLADDALRAYRTVRPEEGYGKWLDFGCGVGRIAVHLKRAGIEDLYGVDPDRGAIRWLRRRYGKESFQISSKRPPLPFPDAAFDVAIAISIFTHMSEEEQFSWLAELSRVLKPGGLLVASTHGRELLVTRDDLTPEQTTTLDGTGFLFAPGRWAFNENSTFHTPEYMEKSWGRWFQCRLFVPKGLMNYQDVSVWRKLG